MVVTVLEGCGKSGAYTWQSWPAHNIQALRPWALDVDPLAKINDSAAIHESLRLPHIQLRYYMIAEKAHIHDRNLVGQK
jgi:hypothetical protein